MLRLTIGTNGGKHPRIRAEGRLVGDYASLLESECLRVLREAPEIELELAEVTDVDARGLAALRRLRGQPIALIGCTPILLALLTDGSAT